jgi:hypothetical protein
VAAPSVATAIKAAEAKLGSPYVYGAEGPSTFDCSGLMVWAWEKAGVTLPRTSQEQAKYGTPVPLSKIRPGDLVTSNWGEGPSSHVGMYIGGGKLIHAPRPGSKVKVANLDANYRSKINSVRRVPGSVLAGVDQAGLPSPGDILDMGVAAGTGGLLAPLKIVGSAMGDVAAGMLSIGKFAEFLLRLALPSTWVRIVCGLLGSLLLLLGLGFLVREARGAA